MDVIEKRADLWEAGEQADACCITTNGTITPSGKGVMGKGNALEATLRYNKPRAKREPEFNLQRKLGMYLRTKGNHVGVLLPPPPVTLVVFPVKHEWMEQASLELIRQSAVELSAMADRLNWKSVILPRPGCGNGGLEWVMVRELIEDLLDDRFIIVHK